MLLPRLQHRPCAIPQLPQQLTGACCLQLAARPWPVPARGFPRAWTLHCSSGDNHCTSTDTSRVLCSKNTSHQPADAPAARLSPPHPGCCSEAGQDRKLRMRPSAFNRRLTLQSRYLGYLRACLFSHTTYTLKKKKKGM